jgi:4-diphosphocytidyl-2-C-methyl-D-erythritol kinase
MNFLSKNSLILKSYAKINVSLRVLSKRDDDYHNLEMVMLPLELHDVIEIAKYPGAEDTYITCDDIGLANARHNLCAKAVEAMRAEFKFKDNFTISIHKEVPFAAGLGGGSSNAAAVMQGVATLLHLQTTPEVMNKIATSIGADVPFFLTGKPAKVTGIGEIISPIKVKKSYNCLIVKPVKGLATKDVFNIADNFPKTATNTDNVILALANGDDALLAANFGNDLYLPAVSLLPEITEVVESLKGNGLPIANMSGSGSSCFALSDDAKKLKDLAHKYEAKGYIVRLTKTMI